MKRLFLAIFGFIMALCARAGYTVVDGQLDGSRLYPQTVHTYKVVIPDSYDGVTPAALYIGLDGILCNAPAVIDSLTEAGVLGPTIQVYLQSGLIRDEDGEIIRYNRSNEFDATDGRFAEFLATELLPEIESKTAPDGRRIVLTENPSARMIFGLSSGGIAAFNAAWHRPDLFGKVYSGCGTFVPMRGGQNIQTVVRKHEPKPLRVFLQDGFSDSWNPLFGSWYEANRLLASALEFAGYDCAFDWAEGGHSVVRTSAIFPQVIAWMFRDGTAPLAVNPTQNNFLAPRLEGAGEWTAGTPEASQHSDMPEAVYPDSAHVAYTAPGTNFLMQALITPQGERVAAQRFYWLHDYDNSALDVADMCFDADGYLWVLTNAGLQACDQNGRVRGVLAVPSDLDLRTASMRIEPGAIVLTDGSRTYRRTLGVNPPSPGTRPASQGQG